MTDILTLTTALKLKRFIAGEAIVHSAISSLQVHQFIKNKILEVRLKGRKCQIVYLPDVEVLYDYLNNVYNVKDLDAYIEYLQKKEATRAENVLIAQKSKILPVRTFQGFLLNTFSPTMLCVNGEERQLQSSPGCFTFVYDYQTLQVPEGTTIVGIENPENFRHIEQQKELFKDISPLFVSRYPQSQHNDFVTWMQTNRHPYLHYGDFDLAGILIYQNEYLKKLGSDRCSFLVPSSVGELLPRYGNRELYDTQLPLSEQITVAREEQKVSELFDLIHREHKGLEQEILIQASAVQPE